MLMFTLHARLFYYYYVPRFPFFAMFLVHLLLFKSHSGSLIRFEGKNFFHHFLSASLNVTADCQSVSRSLVYESIQAGNDDKIGIAGEVI